MKILLVDDEKDLTYALSVILERNNFEVDSVLNGEDGLYYALTGVYDVIILDVMMPKMNGFEVLKTLRNKKITTPVIMLTAKSDVSDKIDGLNLGADDYVAKPFNTEELVARIKALQRRGNKIAGNVVSCADFELDLETSEIIKGDKKLLLSKKEFQIMELLTLNSGKIVEKERITEKIWGYDSDAEYNAVEVYISFLRKKLAAINSTAEIRSIRGKGYSVGEKK